MIHNAVKFGSFEMIKYLVEHGAELTNEENLNIPTILFLACEGGNASIVDYLLQHRAFKDVNNWKLSSPLAVACQKGHTTVVQTLMRYNVDIRKEKEPLMCGNNEIIDILNVELKRSLKHREKIQILERMDNEDLTKVILHFYCMQSKKAYPLHIFILFCFKFQSHGKRAGDFVIHPN